MSRTANCGPSMPSPSSGCLSSSSTTGYTANPPARRRDGPQWPLSAAAGFAEQFVQVSVVETLGEGGVGAGSKQLAGTVADYRVGGPADRGAEADAGDAEVSERADLRCAGADHDVQRRIHALDQRR